MSATGEAWVDPGTGKTIYTPNPGEIKLTDFFDYYNSSLGPDHHLLIGTSYAAPELSYFAALYVLHGGNYLQCQGSRGTSQPPLAYAKNNTPPGPFASLILDVAANDWCTDFPR